MFGPIDVAAASAVAVPVGLLVGLVVWRRAARRSSPDGWVDGAAAGWVAAVLVVTLTPLQDFGRLAADPKLVVVPFERLDGAPGVYALANLLLLAPLGALLVLRGARPRIALAVGLGVAVSLGIETLQLLHPERGTNVDDLILNSIGVVIGALLGAALRPLRRRST